MKLVFFLFLVFRNSFAWRGYACMKQRTTSSGLTQSKACVARITNNALSCADICKLNGAVPLVQKGKSAQEKAVKMTAPCAVYNGSNTALLCSNVNFWTVFPQTVGQEAVNGVQFGVIPVGQETFLIDLLITIVEACGVDLTPIKVCPISFIACLDGFVTCGKFFLQQALDISPVGKLLEDVLGDGLGPKLDLKLGFEGMYRAGTAVKNCVLNSKNQLMSMAPTWKSNEGNPNWFKTFVDSNTAFQTFLRCLFNSIVPQGDTFRMVDPAIHLSFAADASAIISGSTTGLSEFGVSLKTGNAIVTHTICTGIKLDLSAGFGLAITLFGNYANIPGDSIVLAAGADVPGTEIGADVEFVYATDYSELYGISVSIGAGLGISPIDLSCHKCTTRRIVEFSIPGAIKAIATGNPNYLAVGNSSPRCDSNYYRAKACARMPCDTTRYADGVLACNGYVFGGYGGWGLTACQSSCSGQPCWDSCDANIASLKYEERECAGTDYFMGVKPNVLECAVACINSHPNTKWLDYGRKNTNRKGHCYCESSTTCTSRTSHFGYDIYKVQNPGNSGSVVDEETQDEEDMTLLQTDAINTDWFKMAAFGFGGFFIGVIGFKLFANNRKDGQSRKEYEEISII